MKQQAHYTFNILFSLCIFIFSASILQAQVPSEFGMGLLIDEEKYAATPRLNYGMKFTGKRANKVSLKPFCPTPSHQGRIGSCTGWATATALTIMRAQQTGLQDARQIKADMLHSPMYIYNQIKVRDCQQGSMIPDALELLKDQGDCLITDFNPGQDCYKMPSETQRQQAKSYRIKEYGHLFDNTTNNDKKLEATLEALAEGSPVIIGMMVVPSFYQLKQERWRSLGNERVHGGHAMVVVGYDEMRKVFQIINSWGTKWGEDGFCLVGYDDYVKYVKYGFQIVLENRQIETDPIQLSGDFELKKFDYYDENEDQYMFKELKPTFQKDGFYTLPTMLKGDHFRMLAKNISKGSYIYVFSLKPNNDVEIIYPLDKAFKMSKSKLPKRQKPVVVSEKIEVQIPEIEDGDESMETDVVGRDHLCILYSDKDIDDIQDMVKQIQQHNSPNFTERLYTAFGNRLMPFDDLNYATDKMSVKASSTNGYIAPIILQVNVE